MLFDYDHKEQGTFEVHKGMTDNDWLIFITGIKDYLTKSNQMLFNFESREEAMKFANKLNSICLKTKHQNESI